MNLEQLAAQPYALHVVPDETTDGGLCYVASHPELDGCVSHGNTVEAAIANLEKARSLYIQTLMELSEPIPQPRGERPTVIWRSVSAALPQYVEQDKAEAFDGSRHLVHTR
jgi:predicted RNase H-like HicB family nuclease